MNLELNLWISQQLTHCPLDSDSGTINPAVVMDRRATGSGILIQLLVPHKMHLFGATNASSR